MLVFYTSIFRKTRLSHAEKKSHKTFADVLGVLECSLSRLKYHHDE
jgi:hypothetical protein